MKNLQQLLDRSSLCAVKGHGITPFRVIQELANHIELDERCIAFEHGGQCPHESSIRCNCTNAHFLTLGDIGQDIAVRIRPSGKRLGWNQVELFDGLITLVAKDIENKTPRQFHGTSIKKFRRDIIGKGLFFFWKEHIDTL